MEKWYGFTKGYQLHIFKENKTNFYVFIKDDRERKVRVDPFR